MHQAMFCDKNTKHAFFLSYDSHNNAHLKPSFHNLVINIHMKHNALLNIQMYLHYDYETWFLLVT